MVDILIKSGRVVTLDRGVQYGDMLDLGIRDRCDIAIKDGLILEVKQNIEEDSKQVIDAEGHIVLPGFIDAHTHALFGGNRLDEFEMKLNGMSYKDIMNKGGGILNTVESTRALSDEEMDEILEGNLDKMSDTGTTTVEVKSGYGLNFETEISMLKAMDRFSSTRIDLVPTYMGAHEFPKELSRDEYIDEITGKHLPEVARLSLAEFCDVFCEEDVYNEKEARRILMKAKELNMGLKVHADELAMSGGASLAGELGATSAEHLIYPSEEGLKAMKQTGVVAVLLPSTSLILSQDKAPIEEFRKSGIPMALGSDFNPGSSPVSSIFLIIGLACYHYGMTVEEAIVGATVNAAHAINRSKEIGSIERGKQADILVLDYKDVREIPYWLGSNSVRITIKSGRICFERKGN